MDTLTNTLPVSAMKIDCDRTQASFLTPACGWQFTPQLLEINRMALVAAGFWPEFKASPFLLVCAMAIVPGAKEAAITTLRHIHIKPIISLRLLCETGRRARHFVICHQFVKEGLRTLPLYLRCLLIDSFHRSFLSWWRWRLHRTGSICYYPNCRSRPHQSRRIIYQTG